jgi:hypothetical protein
MNVLTNSEKYQAMRDALNEYYWDNSISPEATAAMLNTFAAEVSRLAKFIQDNWSAPDPRSPTLRAPVLSEQKCPYCNGRKKVYAWFKWIRCAVCNGTGISTRSDGG